MITVVLTFSLFCTAQAQQAAIRYQGDVKGGATMFGNSWFYSLPSEIAKGYKADVDSDNTTSVSCSADLILPAGSTIVKAFLTLQKTRPPGSNPPNAANDFTSVKLKVPGASNYQTITTSGPYGLKTRKIWYYQQAIFDITSLMPATGYVSTATGGPAGRYFVADPMPTPRDSMGGWSIIVVYSSPATTKLRNITVADTLTDCGYFGAVNGPSIVSNLPGVKMPNSGTVTAVLGVTGVNGKRGSSGNLDDSIRIGGPTGTLSRVTDPMTGSKVDILNSSIAMAANNNVAVDAGLSISGNITTRNPISAGHFSGISESYLYDSDIFDVTGLLPSGASPITVRVAHNSMADYMAFGSYFLSVDLLTLPILSKTVSPSTITSGGTATYTFTIANTGTNAIQQTGIAFTDDLPAGLKVAAIPNPMFTIPYFVTIFQNQY